MIGYEVFPCVLREWLPCIPVPLKQGEPKVPLDLRYMTNRAYECGPYLRGAIDYSTSPDPPLPARDLDWAAGLVHSFTDARADTSEGRPATV
jgi:hypothetical protein